MCCFFLFLIADDSSQHWNVDVLFPFLQAGRRYKVTRITAVSTAISVEFVGMCWSPHGSFQPFVKQIFKFLRLMVMAKILLIASFVQTSQAIYYSPSLSCLGNASVLFQIFRKAILDVLVNCSASFTWQVGGVSVNKAVEPRDLGFWPGKWGHCYFLFPCMSLEETLGLHLYAFFKWLRHTSLSCFFSSPFFLTPFLVVKE